ncbi:MAG: hypothetical protein PXX73_09815 [Sideroxydans sp.]|nr:hypothetical protein [Sideroxydans sp.]
MKKIVLSLAGVMAAVAFAPEASAVPVFARQTGMACSACHFQHFPLLNGFGRAFKSAGFTMMGAQGKVEGDHLDIPDRLNMGILTTMRYETVSGTPNAARYTVPSSGGETAIFLGGRISEFAGFLSEIAGAAKLAVLFPVADARVGFVAHTSGGQGVAYSFETQNTGAANTHKTSFYNGSKTANGGAGNHTNVTSASQYLATNGAATGISLVANNSMGFVNIGKFISVGGSPLTPGAGAGQLPTTYARVAANMDVAGFDAGFGIQNFSGFTGTVPGQVMKATIIDAQLQGEVADLPAGFYASYGSAPVAKVGEINVLNAGTNARRSLNVVGEIGVIPHIATVIAGVRMAKTGAAVDGGDNGLMLGATYELAQNIELSLTHTRNSGAAWNAVGGVTPAGKTETGLMMEALF